MSPGKGNRCHLLCKLSCTLAFGGACLCEHCFQAALSLSVHHVVTWGSPAQDWGRAGTLTLPLAWPAP